MELKIRKPAVSGQFYPAEPDRLREEVDHFLMEADPPKLDGRLRALIVPHAGYMYSGQVAAYAYKILREYDSVEPIRKVILIGPAHTIPVEEWALDDHQQWSTPLGNVPLGSCDLYKLSEAHRKEHCLEVQLPFLQSILRDFKIVPILVGNMSDFQGLIAEIRNQMDEHTVLLVTSDLSHYYSYEEACELDHYTIKSIVALDLASFIEVGVACGKKPIRLVMELAIERNWTSQFLTYMNSGDVTSDKTSVVGYAGIAFSEN